MDRDRLPVAAVMAVTACLAVVVVLLMGSVAPADHRTPSPSSMTVPCATADADAGSVFPFPPFVTTTTEPCEATDAADSEGSAG